MPRPKNNAPRMDPVAVESADLTLAEYIGLKRKALKMTQADLAQKLTDAGYPYSSPSVAHWEAKSAPIQPPITDAGFVKALAKALRTTPLRILEVAGLWDQEDYEELVSSLSDLDLDPEFVKFFLRLQPAHKKLVKNLMESLTLQHSGQ